MLVERSMAFSGYTLYINKLRYVGYSKNIGTIIINLAYMFLYTMYKHNLRLQPCWQLVKGTAVLWGKC